MRNIITSMRLVCELEWSDYFECVSLVDEALAAARHAAGDADRQRDPGYHLIGPGRRAFESVVDYRPRRLDLVHRLGRLDLSYGYRGTTYTIVVENPDGVGQGVAHAELDDLPLSAGPTVIALVDDGNTHRVRLVLGSPRN